MMKRFFTTLFELIVRLVNFILQKKEKSAKQIEKDEKRSEDVERLKEDNALKEAIQRGDYETVEKIREKKKHYSNL